MCGITGIINVNNKSNQFIDETYDNRRDNKHNDTQNNDNRVNNIDCNLFTELYEGLFHLQHRGQDSVGIGIFENDSKCTLVRKMGLIHNLKEEFHNLNSTRVLCGLGHIRYSTNNGLNDNGEEYDKLSQIQPIFKKNHNNPYNIYLCHNGHMIIDKDLLEFSKANNISTIYNSDSELLYNIFHYLLNLPEIPNLYEVNHRDLNMYLNLVINMLCSYCKGSYSIICVIENIGMICFKDNRGIRPLSYGVKDGIMLVASESIALSSQNYQNIKELANDEILISQFNLNNFSVINKQDIQGTKLIDPFPFLLNERYNLSPCIFEWIYLARAESIIYNIPVYTARLHMGRLLAEKIKVIIPDLSSYDYVIPIPDTSRPYALSISYSLGIPYIEAIIKNRYIYRTFIMDSQEKRKHNLKRKLNVIPSLIKNKNIIIVDDSIVRGNTMNHIIQLLKQTQVGKITVVSAAPQIVNKNTYGLDIPTKGELISSHYTSNELAKKYNVEHVIFQDIANLYKTVYLYNKKIRDLEVSIFKK
jgi:amidophosphoribosyltransferase